MENVKLVKVYSNNSKKSRLKRNKNPFQRVWDAEKQTYIKVRKSRRPARIQKTVVLSEKEKNVRIEKEIKKRSQKLNTKKVNKSVPVITIKKTEKAIKPVVHAKRESITRIGGVDYTWNEKTLRYMRAAQY